jgi:hypothetical protein
MSGDPIGDLVSDRIRQSILACCGDMPAGDMCDRCKAAALTLTEIVPIPRPPGTPFTRAHDRLNKIEQEIAHATADGQRIDTGMLAIRQGALDMVDVMRELVIAMGEGR